MNCLTKKISFISGATSGLGKELSIHLARKGYHVLIHGRNQNKLNSLYEELCWDADDDLVFTIEGDRIIIRNDSQKNTT